MKHSFLMLAVIGMIHYSANAQNREAKKSEFDINYKVCRIDNRYYTTCSDNTPTVVYTKAYKKYLKHIENKNQKTIDGLRRYDSYVVMHPLPAVDVVSKKYITPLVPSYAGVEAARRHLPMLENDGYAKINERNLNYLNTSVELPANDGGLADRK